MPASSNSDLAAPEIVARIAAIHTAAFREITGKWRERQTLVRTERGGTFFPSDVRILAAVLPRLGLGGRVLEVGSGDGRLLSLLSLLRQTVLPGIGDVIGVEVEPAYIEVSRRARARLSPPLDYARTGEVCDDVLNMDLSGFDALLYFSGGAMPEQAETAFRRALARELRPEAMFVTWGPDAEGFALPRRAAIAVPGYHTVYGYGGRGPGRPRGRKRG